MLCQTKIPYLSFSVQPVLVLVHPARPSPQSASYRHSGPCIAAGWRPGVAAVLRHDLALPETDLIGLFMQILLSRAINPIRNICLAEYRLY